MNDNITQNNIHNSIEGVKIRVNIKVIIQITQSCFSIFQAVIIGSNLIRSKTETIIIADRVAIGR